MVTRRGRPTHAEAKALDNAVREAAVANFVQHGYSGANMESIARAAGITKRSLYARYADKRALFAEVIPWALARYEDEPVEHLLDADLETALLRVGRASVVRATHPQNIRLKRIALAEAALFPEFNLSAESMRWSESQRAVTELLNHHSQLGHIVVEDVEVAAEQFLTLVESVPARMAEFGVARSKSEQERHLRSAIGLFLRGAEPR